MKKLLAIGLSTLFLTSCGVQQFNVNTDYRHTKDVWTVFGENTRNKPVAKGGDFFIIGINVTNTNTRLMAQQLQADSYTVETKVNSLSVVLSGITSGVVGYKRIKVIKRENSTTPSGEFDELIR